MYPGAHVDSFPDKPALIMAESGEVLTYRELEDNSVRLARHLRAAGLRPGDHLALLSGNDPKVYEVYWAALRSGLYITAVNRHLSPSEISYIVDDCGARALIVSAALAESAEKVVAETPAVEIRLAFGGDVPGHASYEDALAASSPEPLSDQPRGADMLYSSGTTGRPKGIKQPLPQRQVGDAPGDTYTAIFGPLYGFGTETVYLSPAPLYHAAPLRFGGVVHALGGTVVVMEKFDAEAALAAIERYRVTHSQWVPTMFVRMLKLDEQVRTRYDVSSLKVAVHAAAPCPIDVKRAMIDWWGPILHEYYASTEANGATFIDSEQWLRKPGSVGKAGLGVIRICGEDGKELPTGEVGTVYFEREDVPFAYHNDPAKTADAVHPDHPTWTTTGDIGYVDDEGYLFLTDRKAFMIISGGVNIYPQEIEDALALHPKVFDVAVIGVPDEEMGESVKAVVQPAPGADPGPDLAAELRDYLRERIAHYKVPRSFDFADDLPRTPTGKLVKGKLRARYL
ncbi:acyl-CoA synthetase [Nocardia farcinica]|uniref:acyl-CoA synthetase n=2 Tax=Nocardiaceae TaxID=85025 RepID=UPI000BF15920|nr:MULTISPECIES: acyl-CoA synthetase [Nocardia]MBF6183837.1 acyl-CoA synthetase [Nocardia farcinica]MBF6257463.1 acyl-CoA synthetase [Nocardia farcinica]MBF6293274.1 acyl-CoA synthetase [Nocardia farcinica]MBF6309680.1 acyl-CoA synthetase [Nocardia farcinica]MBF6374137.1 acyl-CoA synthetase [Nocardia farcinica]